MKKLYNLNQEGKNKSTAIKLIHLVKMNQWEWLGKNHRCKLTPMISKLKF